MIPPRPARSRALGRAALVLAAFASPVPPALAREARPAPSAPVAAPALKGDITAERDTILLGDLVRDLPPGLAERAVFRAPALGETGTIQVRRILEAASGAGLEGLETGGRVQVQVQRAARRIGAAEIEAALREALSGRTGLDGRGIAVVFDGALPTLTVPPDVTGAVTALDLAYDPRGRRIAAMMVVGGPAGERRASLRVAGAIVETVEVATLLRGIGRGETVQPQDLAIERRPRDAAPSDIQTETGLLAGQVARRALTAGTILRVGDLARPELVSRGDSVTIVVETPGMNLSLRARANEAGAMGDLVSVTNLASKRVLQATVTGPGRVTVGPAGPGRVAAATPSR